MGEPGFPLYIEPGSPRRSPYVESFSPRVRDELLSVEVSGTLTEARIVTEAWRMEYGRGPLRVTGRL
jgi:hypothetical protein